MDSIAVKPKSLVCGLIMPISQLENLPPAHWDEVKEVVSKTVEDIADPIFTARLVSEGDDAGVIHKRIIQNVYSDDIAICDVSGRNANVMFELGMRLAFDKPTVIIKDDQTPRIFDTDVIEYVTYRRDLRYAAIEGFKTKLAQKVVSTYNLYSSDPEKQSFLKSFGTFKVVKLDESSESPDKAMLTMLGQMERQLNRLTNLNARRPPLRVPRDSNQPEADMLLSNPEIHAAMDFVRSWAKEHPDFSSTNALRNEEFVDAVISQFPSLCKSPSMLRTLVEMSM